MRAAIDRIDEGIAVLIPEEDVSQRLRIPASLLPPGCREGDIVTLAIGRDESATDEAKEQVAARIRRMQQGSR